MVCFLSEAICKESNTRDVPDRPDVKESKPREAVHTKQPQKNVLYVLLDVFRARGWCFQPDELVIRCALGRNRDCFARVSLRHTATGTPPNLTGATAFVFAGLALPVVAAVLIGLATGPAMISGAAAEQ